MINFILIIYSNFRAALGALHRMVGLRWPPVPRITGFLLFPFPAQVPVFWFIVSQHFILYHMAVHNKHCSELITVDVMPEEKITTNLVRLQVSTPKRDHCLMFSIPGLEILTPKRDDKHPQPFHMGIPAPLPNPNLNAPILTPPVDTANKIEVRPPLTVNTQCGEAGWAGQYCITLRSFLHWCLPLFCGSLLFLFPVSVWLQHILPNFLAFSETEKYIQVIEFTKTGQGILDQP